MIPRNQPHPWCHTYSIIKRLVFLPMPTTSFVVLPWFSLTHQCPHAWLFGKSVGPRWHVSLTLKRPIATPIKQMQPRFLMRWEKVARVCEVEMPLNTWRPLFRAGQLAGISAKDETAPSTSWPVAQPRCDLWQVRLQPEARWRRGLACRHCSPEGFEGIAPLKDLLL